MAKASDLIGKSGSGGYQPQRPTINIQPPEKKEEHDHSATKLRPAKDSKPHGGSGGGGSSTPTSVRPKV